VRLPETVAMVPSRRSGSQGGTAMPSNYAHRPKDVPEERPTSLFRFCPPVFALKAEAEAASD
jgi:hypothetical protein